MTNGKGEADSDIIEHKGQNLMQLWFECGRDVFVFYDRIMGTAPQAECAAMIINSGDCAHCGGRGCFACLKNIVAAQWRAENVGAIYDEMKRKDAGEVFKDVERAIAAGAFNSLSDAEKDAALTNPEISRIWMKVTGTYASDCPWDVHGFARAILAAKEKK